jgi:hypothetical protein
LSDTRAMRLRHLVLLAATILSLAAAATALGGTKPSLTVRRDLPLTLHGSGFRAHEAVRVTVRMGERRWVRDTHAGLAGGFTVQLAGVALNHCALPLAISARGARTGTVSAKLPPWECAAP